MKTQKLLSLFQQQKKGLTQYYNPGCQRWHKKCYYMPWPQLCIESQRKKHDSLQQFTHAKCKAKLYRPAKM